MKKIFGISVLIATVAVAGLCGCASNSGQSQASQPPPAANPPPPPKDKRPLQDRLAVGMSMDEVRAACGNPKNVTMNSNGSAVWGYNDAEKAYIPNYMMFGGTIHFLRIVFDTNGRVVRWSTWTHSRY